MVKGSGSKFDKKNALRKRKQAAFKAANRKVRRQNKNLQKIALWAIEPPVVSVGYIC